MAASWTPVIISGIAGRFPESDGLIEFCEHLYNGVDMVTDCRRGWNAESLKIPGRMGQVKHLDKFDADFFGVHSKQAENMDPRLRILLEVSQECITDAGIHTSELSGSNTAVYVGASGEEAGAFYKESSEAPSGYSLPGALLSAFANRLSFTFNLRGPSITLDTACSSSLLALQQALSAIRAGVCDSALVAGVHLCLDPKTTLLFTNFGMTTADGKCKSFDSAANGFARSEAAVALLLCKEEGARRCYAKVIHANTNTDGYKANGFTYPSGEIQEVLLRQVYAEAGVDPKDVGYIEAHGTGTQAGDYEEINAIARVFCGDQRDSNNPLLIGSVKSNMGHSEPASGLCGIAKLLLISQKKAIPGNLHFVTPNPKIPALLDGRIKVVASNTPFEGELVAISSFGFGGSNVHAVLKFPSNDMDLVVCPLKIPLIFPMSGRTGDILSSLEGLATKGGHGMAALLQIVSRYDTPGHGFRSFALVDGTGAASLKKNEEQIRKGRRPLVFVFSGNGTQYEGMADDMMRLDIFRLSIQKSSKILLQGNFDLNEVLSAKDGNTLQDIENSTVSIVAVQIALMDLLEGVGLVPERILGHSLGEIPAAYADKCLTAEQALNLTLIRGQAFRSSIPGAMASVGLSWQQALEECPSQVFPACDNSADNVTISGNAEQLRQFVSDLRRKRVFAKFIPSSGMAFHSLHMKPCAAHMREYLPSVIPKPRVRSSKWLSTSVPHSENSSNLYQLCSVDYWINNAIATVRFREALDMIPGNAVAIELAPHSVLQSILKRGLPPTVTNIGLMSRKAPNNCNHFLEALGEIYLTGHNPDFGALYDPVNFPVGPSTPMISPAIRWDHSKSWTIPIQKESPAGGAKVEISPRNERDRFYLDHVIAGRIIFPAVGYMHIVWSTFAKRRGLALENCAVTFENVRFERSTLLSAEGTTEFYVNIQPESGDFEVFEGESTACRGRIQALDDSYTSIPINWSEISELAQNSSNCADEIYKSFRLRGYGHSGVFRALEKADVCGEWTEIGWTGNWVGFLDSVLQIEVIRAWRQGLFLPTRIQKALFHPQLLLSYMSQQQQQQGNPKIPTKTLEHLPGTIAAPGIQFCGVKVALAQARLHIEAPSLSAYKYLPFVNSEDKYTDFEDFLTFCLEIAMDNTLGSHFTIVEFTTPELVTELVCLKFKDKLAPKFQTYSLFVVSDNCAPRAEGDVQILNTTELRSQNNAGLKPDLIILSQGDLSVPADLLENNPDFLLCIGSKSADVGKHLSDYQSVAQHPDLQLYRRKQGMMSKDKPKAIRAQENNFDWVERAKKEIQDLGESSRRLYLFTDSIHSGLHGLVQCLRREGYSQLRAFDTLDQDYPFDFERLSKDLREVMELDLVYNVYSSGGWGCFTRLTLGGASKNVVLCSNNCFAHIVQPGDLSSLQWIQSPLTLMGPDEDDASLCEVMYSALNFRDVMLATGKLSRDALPAQIAFDERILGMEYSGSLRDGTRIFGLQPAKCLATTLELKQDELGIMLKVPKGWSMAEAATVTVAYATAYYALVLKGKIREEETVLIHSGAGGVGIAAIAVALSRSCKVITTVSTEEKRAFLKGRFPQLTDASFANSRDPVSFEDHVMRVTNGRGVDVVLNSLSQKGLQASVRCLASSGRFLEIGKFDLSNNSDLGMELFLRSAEFHGVLLDNLFQSQLSPFAVEERERVKELFREGVESGEVSPLPYTEYASDKLEEAFRFMASGKHLGKVLVKIRDEPQTPANITALARAYFYPHKTYILVGGLGGMGLELADWMVTRGASKLVFVSRSGVRSWYQKYRVRGWEARGASITISTADVTTSDGVISLLKTAEKIGPIGGIFNLAAELRDAMFVNQTSENFEVAAKPKIQATLLLDRFSRELAENVDYFVVFSSAAALTGNPGQSNYAFANSAMERICIGRRATGRHGLAIRWGPIGEVGLYHRQTGGEQGSIAGCDPQRIASVLDVMDPFLTSSASVVSSLVLASSNSSRKGDTSRAESLAESVARVLGIRDISKVGSEDSFTVLGMDSLMLPEIKQLLERKLGFAVASATIMSMTFAKLAEMEMDSSNSASPTQGNEDEAFLKRYRTPLVLPKSTLVSMESKQTKSSSLFLVHPMEGNVLMLKGLVKDLDCTVYGLECPPNSPLSSIPALAAHYVESIKEVQAQGPFKLAGYSYGAAVACEMTIQLEAEGHTVERLVLLDGSHEVLRLVSETVSANFKSTGKTLWLLSFLLLYSDQEVEQVRALRETLPTSEGKLDYISGELVQHYPAFSPEDIKNLALAFVRRMLAGQSYIPSAKIKCPAILIRASKSGHEAALGQDYGLGEIFESEVKVIVVDGPHHCFCEEPTELQIAQIINALI